MTLLQATSVADALANATSVIRGFAIPVILLITAAAALMALVRGRYYGGYGGVGRMLGIMAAGFGIIALLTLMPRMTGSTTSPSASPTSTPSASATPSPAVTSPPVTSEPASPPVVVDPINVTGPLLVGLYLLIGIAVIAAAYYVSRSIRRSSAAARAEREAAREAAAAEAARAAEAREQAFTGWAKLHEEHDETVKKWALYDTDAKLLLAHPFMRDFREPIVRKVAAAISAADHLRRDEPPLNAIKTGNVVSTSYADAVTEATQMLRSAEAEARRVRLLHYQPGERRRIEKARDLLNLALDEAATPAERVAAYERVVSLLDGVVVLPEKARANLEIAAHGGPVRALTMS